MAVALACGLILTLAACGGGAKKKDSGIPGMPSGIPSIPDLTGATGDTDGAKLCALFSSDDIEKLVGAKVDKGTVSGPGGSACSWDYKGPEGSVMIQQMPSDYWNPLTGIDGYREIPDLGDEAYVGPSQVSGWDAGVLLGDTFIIAGVDDQATDTSEQAVALLKETVKRLG